MCCGGGNCSEGICAKCKAGKLVAIGGLVLLNIYAWPKWTGSFDKWLAFFAVLLIIKGVLKFIMPNCPHCKPEAPAKKGK
ncbi:hypothetical protein HYU17_06070 [Candidatus Woesearchaeota archaeon]|nr:hypothetical protein [Candidatus Woesearchaeota archaeon]